MCYKMMNSGVLFGLLAIGLVPLVLSATTTTRSTIPAPINWCLPAHCPNSLAHIACNNNGMYAQLSAVNPDQQITLEPYVPLSEMEINFLVGIHNGVRVGAASPANQWNPDITLNAARMAQMVWSEQLADLALLSAKRLRNLRDGCRNTPTFKNVGQNIGLITYVDAEDYNDSMFRIFYDWWGQVMFIKNSDITKFTRTSVNGNTIENYLQIIKDTSTHIGCARVNYRQQHTRVNGVPPPTYQTVLVCNYASGLKVGSPVYATSTTTGSGCTKGVETINVSHGLCKITEPINPNL